jgi:predicted FMN-binding regulatory protein PaiB
MSARIQPVASALAGGSRLRRRINPFSIYSSATIPSTSSSSISHAKTAPFRSSRRRTSRFMLDASEAPASDDASPPPLGALRGHIARKNPHAIASIAACYSQDSDPTETATSQALDQEVMIVFNSPVESYVSPSFYTHSKPLDGKVIPTWFFSAVQVYGNLTIHASTRSATAT